MKFSMSMYFCVDCGFDTCAGQYGNMAGCEYYMVNASVWSEAGMTMHGGMLCIGCLEQRLGRQLRPQDFPNFPINTGAFPQSERLRNRLGLTSVSNSVTL